MAALSTRKRKQNVRSSSSCSSVGSNENGMETGYVSDNSTSDMDLASRYRANDELRRFARNDCLDSSNYKILKKQFFLNTHTKRDSNDSDKDIRSQSCRQPKCNNKNAVNARLNRMKKKQQLNDLEETARKLTTENSQLKKEKEEDRVRIQKLEEEVKYLKSVLANSPEISMLLKCVRKNTNLPVTSSLNAFADSNMESQFDLGDPVLSSSVFNGFSDDLLEPNISMMSAEVIGDNPPVGICLHVAQHRVSLEFCPSCSNSAASSWEDNIG